MMVLSINPQTHSIGILSIPRDTQINLDGVDAKFNEAYYAHGITGEQGTIDQVEALTGLKIDYYFDTTFAKFEELIDGLGGVTVNVPVSLDWSDVVHDGKDGPKTHVEAGEGQTLNGAEALIFSRVRKVYSYEGEAVRQVNARQVVKSAISFVASRPETETPVYVELMERLCKTNMDAETLQAYVDAFTGTDIAFQTGSGPYVGGMYGEIWLIPRDEAAYAALADAMKNGGDMQAIVADPPVVL